MKRCSSCKIEKPQTEYWRDVTRIDGKDHTCKDCRKLSSNKIKHANRVKKSIELHPKKQSARLVIRRMLTNGEIVKEKCFLCEESNTHAHHINYDYPHKVIWLCTKHHAEVHHA